MHGSFVAEVNARRHAIKHAWERRLRNEPITSPLANPDTLVLLMDRTLDELVASLADRALRRQTAAAPRPAWTGCLCGLNPLLAYYRVGASVFATVVGVGSARCPDLTAAVYASCTQAALGELQVLAQREIRAFCAMCQTEIARGARPAHNHLAAQAGR